MCLPELIRTIMQHYPFAVAALALGTDALRDRFARLSLSRRDSSADAVLRTALNGHRRS